MKLKNKQITTEKILWVIFNLAESIDFILPRQKDFRIAFSTSFGYNQILKKMRWNQNRIKFVKFIDDFKLAVI